MATVRLTDIIEPTVFMDLPAVDSPEKTALFESGIIIQSPLLNELAQAKGKTAELPFWNDLDADEEPDLANDNPADTSTPSKVDQGEQIARKLFLAKSWSTADLINEIAMGARAMDHIRAKVDKYYMRQWQRRLIAAARGVLADNVANDSSDMVNDVAIEDGVNATAANLFGRSAFTTAGFTAGDAYTQFSAFAVHSVVYKRMVDNDDIEFIPDSEGRMTIPTYMGKRVIVDDGMPVVAGGTSGFKYTSILFGQGAFGYGEGMPTVPVEVEREAAQGNGGGIETLFVRKTWILHPFGFQYTGTPAGFSPSNAEFAAAASWDRVIDRKLVPLAFLITNG